jgi:hypothetical protein
MFRRCANNLHRVLFDVTRFAIGLATNDIRHSHTSRPGLKQNASSPVSCVQENHGGHEVVAMSLQRPGRPEGP